MRPVGTELLPLFDPPGARRSDPQTSKDAAAAVVDTAARHRERILRALRHFGVGGCVYTEIAKATGLEPVAVNRRLAELRRAGLVIRRDETRRTPSGCYAHIYVCA